MDNNIEESSYFEDHYERLKELYKNDEILQCINETKILGKINKKYKKNKKKKKYLKVN
jgi:hypothetical protein